MQVAKSTAYEFTSIILYKTWHLSVSVAPAQG